MSSTATSADPQTQSPAKTAKKRRSFWAILKETVSNWMDDNAMRLSAALSLYTILSLAPLLVVTMKLMSVIWRDKASVHERIQQQMVNLMGSSSADAITSMLNNAGKHGSGILATIISFAVLLFSATGVFIELQDSMNTVWGVKPKPNQGLRLFIHQRLLSLAMVFGIAFLLLVSMFVSTALTSIAKSIAGNAKWVSFGLDIIVSFLVISLLFAAIFKFLPDVKLKWRHVWAGAFLTSALFILGKWGLALYFKFGTPTSAFGAAGSLAAVLLWVYYSAFILFFGAEFTKVWSELQQGFPGTPETHAVRVTEDERARHGIPSKRRMEQALHGRFNGRHNSRPATERMPKPVATAYILFMSALAGGLGAGYWAGRHDRVKTDPPWNR